MTEALRLGRHGRVWIGAQVVPKDGKFYYYVTVKGNRAAPGNNIGVAVADSPTGPFKDSIGKPLVRDSMTPKARRPWEDIDPTVWIGDGTRGCRGAMATVISSSSSPT